MKKTLLLLTLIILFILSGTSAALIAFVEIAPIFPEQRLFPLQNNLEHALLVFYKNPTSKSWYELKILDNRIKDLENIAGKSEEIQRFNAVWTELDHVLKRFEEGNSDEVTDLRFHFIKTLTRFQENINQFIYMAENYPKELLLAQERLNRLKILALADSNPLSDLFEMINMPLKSSEKASSLNSPVSDYTIDQHRIPFLPGSSGANHIFFPLEGKHAVLSCEGCHGGITYAGLPDECVDCHLAVLPNNHYQGLCSLCHTATGWIPAEFDHSLAVATDCESCHLINKPVNHFPGQCSSCHSTNAWLPASFDHAVAGATNCQSCHSGNKPANHFSGQCSACHSTNAWLPASFNHAAVGATDCQSCHSGNKPANHFSGQCSACHSTNGWRPASFNHAAVGATDCQSCHSGNKPANHFDGQCSSCHNTNTWSGASFNHSFPMDHETANGECAKCHPSGGSNWTCFNCHDQTKMTEKHEDEGIPDYVSRCMECHGNGEKND